MLLAASVPLLSGGDPILSRQLIGQPALDPTEPHADGVGRGVENRRDLPGLESLPGPQPDHLAVALGQPVQRSVQRRVRFRGPVGAGRLPEPGADPLEEPGPPLTGAPVVGEAAASDPVGPRKRAVGGYVLEAAPHHEEHLVEEIVDILGRRAATEVSLERLVHLPDDRPERVLAGGGARSCGFTAATVAAHLRNHRRA
ncbi:MAG TPA: hypothetical protein VNT54_09425, partial [Solirubrobacteraceae bacterium]|nr:hypothetical protein [Solirubrobacteraceae bacterium]